MDDEKVIIHYKSWDLYMNKRQSLIKGGYFVEVSCYDGKKTLWSVLEDHVVD